MKFWYPGIPIHQHYWARGTESILGSCHLYIKGHVDTWLMSLAPMIGESACLWKSKTSVRKNPVRAKFQADKIPCIDVGQGYTEPKMGDQGQRIEPWTHEKGHAAQAGIRTLDP